MGLAGVQASGARHQASSYWAITVWDNEAMMPRGYEACKLSSYYLGTIVWQLKIICVNVRTISDKYKKCENTIGAFLLQLFENVGKFWKLVFHCLGHGLVNAGPIFGIILRQLRNMFG